MVLRTLTVPAAEGFRVVFVVLVDFTELLAPVRTTPDLVVPVWTEVLLPNPELTLRPVLVRATLLRLMADEDAVLPEETDALFPTAFFGVPVTAFLAELCGD